MKYTLVVTLDKNIDQVLETIVNPENFGKWQKTFVDYEVISGVPGEKGCVTTLNYKSRKTILSMKETLLSIEKPNKYSVTYETDTVWNQVDNRFHKLSEYKTQWTFETHFKCQGWLKVMSKVMPFIFKSESRKAIKGFKDFIEAS